MSVVYNLFFFLLTAVLWTCLTIGLKTRLFMMCLQPWKSWYALHNHSRRTKSCLACPASNTCSYNIVWQHRSQASPVICSSVCVQQWKSAKKRGRPGNTYHMNDVWWMQGGRWGRQPQSYKLIYNSQSEFLTGGVKYCRSHERLESWQLYHWSAR